MQIVGEYLLAVGILIDPDMLPALIRLKYEFAALTAATALALYVILGDRKL